MSYQWNGKFTGDKAYCENCGKEYEQHISVPNKLKLQCPNTDKGARE